MAYEFSRLVSCRQIGFYVATTAATLALDSAYVHYTSGDVVGGRFIAPVQQTSATLTVYAYCTALSDSSVSDVRCALYDGPTGSEDIDRPTASAALATSAAVDLSSVTAPDWITFTITASLTRGQTYYLLIDNRTADPGTHYPTFQTRALLGVAANACKLFRGVYATNGFSADGTTENYAPAMVVKFSDGTLIGCPYVTTEAHASNANPRGICITPSEDLVVSGILSAAYGSALSGHKIRITGGADVVTATVDRGGQADNASCTRFAPTTLNKGTRYDILHTVGSATTLGTIYTMGEASPPADVQSCTWPGAGYIDNTTIDATKIMNLALIVDDNPAIDVPVAGNVTEDDTVRGASGTYHEAAAAEVQSGVQFGAGGTEYTGTYSGGSGGGFPVLGGSVVR